MISLATRVARSTALSIAVAGVVVAASAGLLADRLVSDGEDRRLLEAADTFAHELVELGDDSPAHAEEEAKEFLEASIHLAAFTGGDFIAGEREVPRVAPGHCLTAHGMRSCGSRGGQWTTAASSATRPFESMRATFALAALVAIVLTTLLGWLIGLRAARWTLAPLDQLRASIGPAASDPHVFRAASSPSGVAEVDALRTALVDAFERLDDALSRSRRFASDAAHELRTPLTTILGELELLADERKDDAALVASLSHARRSALRLTTLVERLLVLATPNERLEVTESIDLGELVEDVILTLPASQRARVTFEGGGPVAARGDATSLGLAVANGLDNALKYSGDGPVTIRVGASEDVATIEIDDEGPGVAPSDRERVFEPFARAKSRDGAVRGHGIGLALVAHVLAVHGGRARFVDRVTGARLCVELPRA